MSDQKIPLNFKQKIIQIWEKFIGSYYHSSPFTHAYFPELFISSGSASPQNLVWKNFHGTFNEGTPSDQDFFQWCCDYLMKNNMDEVMPLIELTFNYMASSDEQAVRELNDLFGEFGLPYAFVDGQVRSK